MRRLSIFWIDSEDFSAHRRCLRPLIDITYIADEYARSVAGNATGDLGRQRSIGITNHDGGTEWKAFDGRLNGLC